MRPLEFMLTYLGAAAVLIAAAIPLPGRRTAYGSAAFACAVIGIGLHVNGCDLTSSCVAMHSYDSWNFSECAEGR